MIPDRSPDIVRTDPMADVIERANVIVVERDPDSDGWFAYIGPSFLAGLGRYAATPGRALLALASDIREKGWVFDESWPGDPALPLSPNVLALRRKGPRDWQEWYVCGNASDHRLTFANRDPVLALCGFALRIKEASYVFDAAFKFP